MTGDNDHSGPRVQVDESSRNGEPVAVGQREIKKEQVGHMLAARGQALGHGPGPAHDLQPTAKQEHPFEELQKHRLVFDEQAPENRRSWTTAAIDSIGRCGRGGRVLHGFSFGSG